MIDSGTSDGASRRVRREAAPFRRAAVTQVRWTSPRLVRVTLAGPELDGFGIDQPAASVRLLIPDPVVAGGDVEVPTWDRNNFVFADGSRPTLRTFTPLRQDRGAADGLDLQIVVHGEGPASAWAASVAEGGRTAVSGPARGYEIDDSASDFLLVGDETAIPAIGQLMERMPADRRLQVVIEVPDAAARIELPAHSRANVDWQVQASGAPPGDSLVAAVASAELGGDIRVWAAGEAAAMQRIRRSLFTDRGLSRRQAWVRGYWKHGRGGDLADGDN